MANIIVACGSAETSERIRTVLENGGHWVRVVAPEAAVDAVGSHRPDLVLVESPPNAEPRFIARIKKARRQRRLPVIVLGNGPHADDAAPDAVVPTGGPGIDFLSLVKRFVKPPPGPDQRFLRHGEVELDGEERTVRIGDEPPQRLPPQHFALLWVLVQRSHETADACSREFLVARVWKKRVRDREVDVTLSRLRLRLPALASRLESVPGRGYRFIRS